MKQLLPLYAIVLVILSSCEIMPRNTLSDCNEQCITSKKPKACAEFCNCIHKRGEPLDSCLARYDKAVE